MGKCPEDPPPAIPACPPLQKGLTFLRMLKIGLIQPETIPGHFSGNLRTIVELYRSCLDEGAELVLCPPLALSGVHTGELALRNGFQIQHQAALAYLAREIANVPLLLGAMDAEGIRFLLLRNGFSFPRQAVIPPSPHGKEHVPVFGIWRTADETVFSIAPWGTIPPPNISTTFLLLRTPSDAWHEGLLEQDEEEARRTAQETKLPVFTVRLAGGEGPFLLPGASSVWSGNESLLKRLRLFERDSAVISLKNSTGTNSALHSPKKQLRHALRKGMDDFIYKSGYGSVCLNLLENSASLLLVALLKEMRPSLTVTGLIPSLPCVPEETREKVQAFADTAGVSVRRVSPPSKAEGLDDKVAIAWLMRQWAEEEGSLLLSSLTRTDIMTAPRFLPAALAADFMPLGDLYETELANLFPGFIFPAPEAAMRDEFLIRLHRKHESATKLANQFPESERDIRRLQRHARASEWTRLKLPPRLMLRSIPGTQETPYIHRLED